jgi:hypothetical protein
MFPWFMFLRSRTPTEDNLTNKQCLILIAIVVTFFASWTAFVAWWLAI